jgi:ribosomal protein L29
MKAEELRELGAEELTHRLDELYQEMLNLRFQLATRQLNDTAASSKCARIFRGCQDADP